MTIRQPYPLSHHQGRRKPPTGTVREENRSHAVINIAVQSILLATKLAAPILIVALGIGLVIGLLQSATQIQEQTLTFVPKLAGIALVILLAGHWMLGEVIDRVHPEPVRDDPAADRFQSAKIPCSRTRKPTVTLR